MSVNAIKKAYRAIGAATPIDADCGLLCGRACCSPAGNGTDAERGMLVFPSERGLLKPLRFVRLSHVRPQSFARSAGFAVCEGHCSRNGRPLSCRIFPLAFYIKPENRICHKAKIEVIVDPRAKPICPLAAENGKYITEKFRRAVKKAARRLEGCPVAVRFICSLSAVLDDYRRFVG